MSKWFGSGRRLLQTLARQSLLLAAATLFSVTAAQADGEPTEDDMRQAVVERLNSANAEFQDILRRCERREFQNDPFLAMQCLSIMSASGGTGTLAFTLTHFAKLGCVPAPGQPGYVCDYEIGIDSSSPMMQGAMGRMMSGGIGQGRFVERGDGWIFIEMN